MFAAPIPYDPLNGADVMALSFATKQAEHLQSVRILVAAKQHRDAFLIARTILEGYGRLLWSFQRVQERPDLWLWYGAILDWRQLGKNENAGIIVDPHEKAMLQEYVDRHGENYLTRRFAKRARKPRRTGRNFRCRTIRGTRTGRARNVRSMFVELGAGRHARIRQRLSPLIRMGTLGAAVDPDRCIR